MPRIQSVNDQTYPLLESFSEQTVQRSELISVSWYNDTTDKIGTHQLLTRTVIERGFRKWHTGDASGKEIRQNRLSFCLGLLRNPDNILAYPHLRPDQGFQNALCIWLLKWRHLDLRPKEETEG